MPAPARTVVPMLPTISDENGSPLEFYGVHFRGFVCIVAPDPEHQPRKGEHQRWVLIIEPPAQQPERT